MVPASPGGWCYKKPSPADKASRSYIGETKNHLIQGHKSARFDMLEYRGLEGLNSCRFYGQGRGQSVRTVCLEGFRHAIGEGEAVYTQCSLAG